MSFHEELIEELNGFVDRNLKEYSGKDIIKIDLHCHDHNSDVPDEVLGRILRVPETWLPTDNLINNLKSNGCSAYTITNHNNARSCFELLDKGFDILVGAEFSCLVPDYETGIHVLTYGFNPEQEVILNKLRGNLYSFMDYALENDLPTIWAHPLYHYKSNGSPPMEFFYKMALVFERFEVINGQRDTWQNVLVKNWVDSLTEQRITELSKQTGLSPNRFTRNPFKKVMTGGSDSHMGIFSGLSGSLLDCSGQPEGLSSSEKALTAIKNGKILPYGSYHNSARMMVSFLDYAFQVVMFSKDPGLMRLILHKGQPKDKLAAWLLVNGINELRRHKVTMRFIQISHECLTGKTPHFSRRWFIPQVYKPIFDKAALLAQANMEPPEVRASIYKQYVFEIYHLLMDVVTKRIGDKIDKINSSDSFSKITINELIGQFEIPASIRDVIGSGDEKKKDESNETVNIPELIDGLPFPFLAAMLIQGAAFLSARVLYNSRPLLNQFAKELGSPCHPSRMLWLADTYGFNDPNGEWREALLRRIHKDKLSVDLVVCSNTIKSAPNLIVIKPLLEFELPGNLNIKLNIPDYLEIHEIFHKNEYDRVMASTEGPMGLAALYLKYTYSVSAGFFMLKDQMTYFGSHLKLDKQNYDRLRRVLRSFYSRFDELYRKGLDPFE